MRSHIATINLTLLAALTLTACGGGGSDTPAPAPAPMTLAECSKTPALGTVNHYVHSQRTRFEWKATTFLGEAVTGRFEYADDAAATPLRVRYTKTDAVTGAVTVVAVDTFDASGALTHREQSIGRTFPVDLAIGQSSITTYTVKVLFPAGQPDRTERLTRKYEGNGAVNAASGRMETCAVTELTDNMDTGTATRVAEEQLYFVKGMGWVKSYFKSMIVSATARGERTYLSELISSTALTLPVSAATADTTPSLASCSAFPPAGQRLVFTSNSDAHANSEVRVTGTDTSRAPLLSETRSTVLGTLTATRYFDNVVGGLRDVRFEQILPTVQSSVLSGKPDLRNTAVGATVNYTLSTTVGTSPATVSADSFTFVGHEKVTTPAGTFDTCKVKYVFGSGASEVYNYVPNLLWVRYDSTDASGVRTLRELISH